MSGEADKASENPYDAPRATSEPNNDTSPEPRRILINPFPIWKLILVVSGILVLLFFGLLAFVGMFFL